MSSSFANKRIKAMKLWKLGALFCLIGTVAAPLSAGMLSLCDSVAGNLVANCGFETEDFTGWTTGGNTSNTGAVSTPYYAYAGPNSGIAYAALGPIGSEGSLSQVLSTTAGASYSVSFYLAGVDDNPSDFTALWDGNPLLSLSDPNTGAAFNQFSFSVTGTGSDTLQFTFRDDVGFIALDDVVVVAPEPGTMGMMIGGIVAALLARHRRRA
jgi:hypothetical protein